MIYDKFGKPIEEIAAKAQQSIGMNVFSEDSDRYASDASRGLTPSKVDAILTAANQGNIAEQSKLALELEEKNWDIAQAMETRRNAVLGIPWTVEPGDDTPAAKKAAEDFKKALDAAGGAMNTVGGVKLDTFNNLRSDMLTAIIAGFSVSEIVWKPGGAIAGFSYLKQRHFSYLSGRLKIVTTGEPNGIDLAPRKFIVNSYRRRGSDLSRGGLIRPLSWLHSFQRLNFTDLLSFIERHGMPFLVAKVDKESWDNERNTLKSLIRNFGPSGGGVFTKAVELELLQASSNTGDVYFKLLEYTGAAIVKIILGQTASSGDSSGLSKGDSQSKVRQDYLEADCSTMDETLNSDLAEAWNAFNSPIGTAAPKIKHHCEPPADIQALAATAKTFYEAGLEADPAEMSAKSGMTLTRRVFAVPPPQGNAIAADSAAFAADLAQAPASDIIAENALANFAGDAGKWAGSFAKTVAKLAEEGTAEEIAALATSKKLTGLFDTQALSSAIEQTIFASAAAGAAGRMDELKKKRNSRKK